MRNLDEQAKQLFQEYIQSLVTDGWQKEQVLPNAYLMTDTVGAKAFISCEIEIIDFQKKVYSLTAKMVTMDNHTLPIHLGVIHENSIVKGDNESYLCQKDWKLNSIVYFKSGRTYQGTRNAVDKSVKMYGDFGVVTSFLPGSEYFAIS